MKWKGVRRQQVRTSGGDQSEGYEHGDTGGDERRGYKIGSN